LREVSGNICFRYNPVFLYPLTLDNESVGILKSNDIDIELLVLCLTFNRSEDIVRLNTLT